MSKKIPSYSEAIAEIESIVEKIETNELDIDEIAQSVKRVAELIKLCKAKLKATEEELDKVLKEFDNE